MATIEIIPASHFQPADYVNSAPVHCNACGQEWDEETSLAEEQVKQTPRTCDWYCVGKCYDEAVMAEYKTAAAAIMVEKLREAQEEIEALEREFDVEDDSHDHPLVIIDDAIGRMDAYGEGRDSGWRNDVMLEQVEAERIKRELNLHMVGLAHGITWRLEREDLPCPAVLGYKATEVATIGNVLLNLIRYTERTQKGGR